MASVSAAMQRIRKARREAKDATAGEFDRYRDEYVGILRAVATLGDDAAFETVRDWLVRTTRTRGRLPTPDEVRSVARRTLQEAGVTVPADSPLSGVDR